MNSALQQLAYTARDGTGAKRQQRAAGAATRLRGLADGAGQRDRVVPALQGPAIGVAPGVASYDG
jgi:hypothetical protein